MGLDGQLIRILQISRVGRPKRHNHNSIRDGIRIVWENVVIEPISENFQLFKVGVVFFRCDFFADSPGEWLLELFGQLTRIRSSTIYTLRLFLRMGAFQILIHILIGSRRMHDSSHDTLTKMHSVRKTLFSNLFFVHGIQGKRTLDKYCFSGFPFASNGGHSSHFSAKLISTRLVPRKSSRTPTNSSTIAWCVGLLCGKKSRG